MTTRLVGNVNSPVRTCQAVKANPFYASQSHGPYIYDQNNRPYIDYVCGFGPILLGHQDPQIKKLLSTATNLSTLGVCHATEERLAEQIHEFMPHIEKIRFTNSGAEAAGVAIRLAKAYSKKTKIIKFVGQYHGATDAVLGYTAPGTLEENGIDSHTASQLICLPFNDTDTLEATIQAHHHEIAGVMMELFSGNMGFIPAQKSFVETAFKLCKQYDILFIADEVMTGFRVHPSGASHLYQISPDLTLLGKVIGGGFPIGAVGGKTEIMNQLSPVGNVYHAGTFAGHPLSIQAGSIVLQTIKTTNTLSRCEQYLSALSKGLSEIFKQKGLPFCIDHRQAMFGFFFQELYPTQYNDIQASSQSYYTTLYHHLRNHGILLPPAHLEAGFITQAHDDACLNKTLEVTKNAF